MGNENVERLTIAIDAKEFAYQGPRFEWLGPNSGESFKKNKLIPFLNNLDDGEQGVIDFTGTMIYSPSFLEESFGGAVR